MRATFAALWCAAMALPSVAFACGVCIEDKVAATYDHAVVTHATAARHVVVFASLEGSGDRQALAADARRAAVALRGVDRGSVRVATDPPALSFALDPAVQSPERALAEIQHAARTPGLSLGMLKVVR